MARTTPILKNCQNCGIEFLAKWQAGRAQRHQLHCGKACYTLHQNRLEHRQALFWAQVEKTPTCWLWTGWKLNTGYGETSLRQRKITVHRLSYIWAYGEIPKGKLIMHTCDTPLCVRPDHLRVGTDATNHADMVSKMRHTWGAKNKHAKLTEDQVREIRTLRGQLTHREIAARYGVSQPTINALLVGRTWRYIA